MWYQRTVQDPHESGGLGKKVKNGRKCQLRILFVAKNRVCQNQRSGCCMEPKTSRSCFAQAVARRFDEILLDLCSL